MGVGVVVRHRWSSCTERSPSLSAGANKLVRAALTGAPGQDKCRRERGQEKTELSDFARSNQKNLVHRSLDVWAENWMGLKWGLFPGRRSSLQVVAEGPVRRAPWGDDPGKSGTGGACF